MPPVPNWTASTAPAPPAPPEAVLRVRPSRAPLLLAAPIFLFNEALLL